MTLLWRNICDLCGNILHFFFFCRRWQEGNIITKYVLNPLCYPANAACFSLSAKMACTSTKYLEYKCCISNASLRSVIKQFLSFRFQNSCPHIKTMTFSCRLFPAVNLKAFAFHSHTCVTAAFIDLNAPLNFLTYNLSIKHPSHLSVMANILNWRFKIPLFVNFVYVHT